MPRRVNRSFASRSLIGPITRNWGAALIPLSDAARYAEEVGCDVWEFALEIDDLLAAGLTRNDLRWLGRAGYMSNAVETTRPLAKRKRMFMHRDTVVFSPRTCFVATQKGLEFIREHLVTAPSSDSSPFLPAVAVGKGLSAKTLIPRWNPCSRTLHFGNALVKEFKVPAANQELVLSAFEEDVWPPHIDDPLPPVAELDPKRRLHHTLNRLNRNQTNRLIRFFGNGNGRAVRWEPFRECRQSVAIAPPRRR